MSIKIHIYLFLMLAYMYASNNLSIFITYYIFIIMHELAHIIVALLLKVDVREVTLLPIGINAKYEAKISNKKELIISLAGPLASFLFSIILKNETFKIINVCIGFYNLIPISPFDGGKIIKNILRIILGERTGRKINYKISKTFVAFICIISIIGVAYFKNYYMVILAIYIFYISKEELEKEQFYGIINYLQTS